MHKGYNNAESIQGGIFHPGAIYTTFYVMSPSKDIQLSQLSSVSMIVASLWKMFMAKRSLSNPYPPPILHYTHYPYTPSSSSQPHIIHEKSESLQTIHKSVQ